MKEAICDIGDISTNLETSRGDAEREVRACFMQLHDLLDQRQTQLINSLNTVVSKKQQTLGELLIMNTFYNCNCFPLKEI